MANQRYNRSGRSWLRLGAALVPVLMNVPLSPARAGGYDTFLWYTARHLGTGGAAVAYVADPSAVFHNPAGLATVGRAQLLLAPALLKGALRAAPAENVNEDATPMIAPFGLLGAAVRAPPWLALGVAVYPLAAAGAKYRYDGAVADTKDETRALFVEASPALALRLPYGLRLGVGYRVTVVSMRRYAKARSSEHPGVDLSLRGVDLRGLRVGAQWDLINRQRADSGWALQWGVTYRHTVRIATEGRGGFALAMPLSRAQTTFTVPARLATGVRAARGPLSWVLDVEYGLNSQNDRASVRVELEDGREADLPNVFGWRDSWGLRTGVEYALGPRGSLPVRLGYAFDGATVTKRYPTEVCAFCGHPGEYALTLHGLYFDLSYSFEDR